MSKEQDFEYLNLLEALENKLKYNKFSSLFPDEGRYARSNYLKHLQFFKAGATCSQRLLAGGNRVGKTIAGAYEAVCHLTGNYPSWWEGKKFLNPTKAWAVGISISVVKEVMQEALLGPFNDIGSGIIPKDCILGFTRRSGVANAIDMVEVKHKSGGISQLIFKSYEQGRLDFQGTKKDFIWMDEEPTDRGIFEECLMRTMDDTNPGIIMMTFTPLLGMTLLVLSFLKDGRFSDNGINSDDPAKFAVQVTWSDVPHMSETQKKELLNSISPHLRDARTKGLPHLGAGAIYPYSEDDIVVQPFEIPPYWPRAYGLDVGWNRTAGIWCAYNPDAGIYYLYSEHYQGAGVPAVHASAIKARGRWITGAIDPASRVTNQADGSCLFHQYADEDLNIIPAENAVESGILKIQQLIESGRLKVFSSLRNWLQEFRTYMRDEKTGKVKDKQADHLMDATRYLIMACPDILTVEPDPEEYRAYKNMSSHTQDSMTGY